MLSLLSTSAKVSVDDNFSLLQTVNYYTVEPQNVVTGSGQLQKSDC